MQSKTVSIDEFNFERLCAPQLYSLLSVYDIDRLYNIASSIRYSGNIKKKYNAINDVLKPRGFVKLAAGTNRVCYRHQECSSIVVKVAIDSIGIHDTPREFINQSIFKPFVTKVFEVSPCGTVGLFERGQPITSREEFIPIAADVYELITRWFTGEYVLEDIGTKFFMNWSLRMNFGPILHDFPYVYKLDGNKLYCCVPDPNSETGRCGGLIDYDDGYNFLYCKKCGARYRASELEKKIKENIIIQKGKRRKRNMVVGIVNGYGEVLNSTAQNEEYQLKEPVGKISRNKQKKKKKEQVDENNRGKVIQTQTSKVGVRVKSVEPINGELGYLGPDLGSDNSIQGERFRIVPDKDLFISSDTLLETETYRILLKKYEDLQNEFFNYRKEMEDNKKLHIITDYESCGLSDDEEYERFVTQGGHEEILISREMIQASESFSNLLRKYENKCNECDQYLSEEEELQYIGYDRTTGNELFRSESGRKLYIGKPMLQDTITATEYKEKIAELYSKTNRLESENRNIKHDGDSDKTKLELELTKQDLQHVEDDNSKLQARYEEQLKAITNITNNYDSLSERFDKMIEAAETERSENKEQITQLQELLSETTEANTKLKDSYDEVTSQLNRAKERINELEKIQDPVDTVVENTEQKTITESNTNETQTAVINGYTGLRETKASIRRRSDMYAICNIPSMPGEDMDCIVLVGDNDEYLTDNENSIIAVTNIDEESMKNIKVINTNLNKNQYDQKYKLKQ